MFVIYLHTKVTDLTPMHSTYYRQTGSTATMLLSYTLQIAVLSSNISEPYRSIKWR